MRNLVASVRLSHTNSEYSSIFPGDAFFAKSTSQYLPDEVSPFFHLS